MSTLRLTTISNQGGTASVPSDTVINGSAKAWVNFNGTGTVAIRASFNVSSITDNGTGNYTINMTNAVSDANYCVTFGSPRFNPGNSPWVFQEDFNTARTASAFRMWTNQNSTSFDADFIQAAVFR